MLNVKLIECINTWQGEGGIHVGERILLVRFKECNLRCVWCDTNVKMRESNELRISLNDLQEIISINNSGLLITGGEPTHPKHFNDTCSLINLKYRFCEIETNGFNLIELIEKTNKSLPISYNYSPKLFKRGNVKDFYLNHIKILDYIEDNNLENVFIKIVACPIEDELEIIENFLREINNRKLQTKTFLMPFGTSREEILNNSSLVFDLAEKYKTNVTTRMHIMYNFF